MKYLLIILFLNVSQGAELVELDVEIEKAIKTNRSRYIPSELKEKPQNYLRMNHRIDLYKKLYWKNTISTEVTEKQFRYIGLDFRIGVDFTENLDIYYRHYSGHILDYVAEERFGEENSIGIRFRFK